MKNVSSKFDPEAFNLGQLTTYQVGAMQASANRALKKHGDALLKSYGITNMQWHIIGAVLDTEPEGIRISDLANLLDTTMAFLTTNVNLLESKGILMRKAHTSDARSRMVLVNANFIPHCHEIEEALRQKLRASIYSKISPAELHTYIKVTAKLAELGADS